MRYTIFMDTALTFDITRRLPGTLARAGVIHTPHGEIRTPAFIVGGTKATVKAITPEQIRSYGGQAVLANTYHLMLRPGTGTGQHLPIAAGFKYSVWESHTKKVLTQ